MDLNEAIVRNLHRSEERIAELERELRAMEQNFNNAQSHGWRENTMRCHVSAAAIDLLKKIGKDLPEAQRLDAALSKNAAETP